MTSDQRKRGNPDLLNNFFSILEIRGKLRNLIILLEQFKEFYES